MRERVAKLTVGDPVENRNVGPVVNKAALETMLRYIEIGKKEGRLVAGGTALHHCRGGFYMEPTVFADIAPECGVGPGGDFWAHPGAHQGGKF